MPLGLCGDPIEVLSEIEAPILMCGVREFRRGEPLLGDAV